MTSSSFHAGVLAGMLLTIAAIGGQWLITPSRHPDATTSQRWFAVLQCVIGLAGFVILV